MAHAYTTKRGKNKKGKLGMRKDAANNAANKLSQKMFAENPLEFLSREDLTPKVRRRGSRRRRTSEARRQQVAETTRTLTLSSSFSLICFLSLVQTLGNSATARRREALESARASLNLLLTGSCGNKACEATNRDANKQLLLCQGCRSKAYCDAVCQKADWKDHKATCKETAAKKAEEAAAASGKKSDAIVLAPTPTPASVAADAAASKSTSAAAAAPTPAAAAAAPAAAATAPAVEAAPATTDAEVDPSALD